MFKSFRNLAGALLLLAPLPVVAQGEKTAPARGGTSRASASRDTVVPEWLPTYRLLDQFNRLITDSALTRRASIIIVASRNGAAAAERWTQSLRAALTPSGPTVIPVADLVGAPRMLRGLIRGMFPKDSSAGVALDWEGVIGRPIRGDRAPLIAAVYGADGRLKEWMTLSTKSEDVATLRRLVALVN